MIYFFLHITSNVTMRYIILFSLFAGIVTSDSIESFLISKISVPTRQADEDFTCSNDYDCDNHGVCDLTTQTCNCDDEYADDDCTYKRKKQLIAFLFDFFINGVGQLYLGYTAWGVCRLVITSIILICPWCLPITIPLFIVGQIWWLTWIILIGTDKINDANGYSMLEW